MYASATGLQKELSFYPPLPLRERTPEDLYRLALRGNPTAKKIWNNFGKALGAGIASIVNVLDIETVILGGGLSGAWKVFFPHLRRSLSEYLYPTTAGKVRVRPALLRNKAGLIGSARSVFSNF